MSFKNYYLVTTTSIVKATNMAKARAVVSGESESGHLLAQDTEIEHKDPSDVSSILSKIDDNYSYTSSLGKYEEDEEEQDGENYHSLIAPNEDVLNFLRNENKRLARLADKHKNTKGEAVASVYEAAYNAFADFEIPTIKRISTKKSKGSPEVAVAVLADWQLGKITPSYNSEVLAKRIELYTEKLIEITEIQRAHHPVDELHIWFLGDIVEGEEIFPGQSHLIDSGLYRQVGVNGPEIITGLINSCLEHFDKIHVTGVIGNHGAVGGRARKQHDPETNMDRLLYKIVELIYSNEDRVTFNIPDGRGERNFYAIDNIGDYSCMLIHGDQMPSPGQFHGYYKKVMGWKDGAIPEHFDDLYMGHYHQKFKMTIGSSTLRISGSPESNNTYAQEYFNSMGRPCQDLLFVHPNNGITSEYTIWLDAV
jgi:hypothetical protein